RDRSLHTLQIERGQFGRLVQRVGQTRLSGLQLWKIADRASNRLALRFGSLQSDRSQSRGEQNQSIAMLRHSEVVTIDDRVSYMEAELLESRQELSEDGLLREIRHVLHCDEIRTNFLHQSPEMGQEIPAFIGRTKFLLV